jgi:hypothetical protein
MRVLICGSRSWSDIHVITAAIKNLPLGSTIIHGACPTGADAIADVVGMMLGYDIERYPANWKQRGRSAGPKRNQQMLDEGKPDYVIAFRSAGESHGTDDMMKRAEKAGLTVNVVEAE